ncbi:hypothetical protein MA16_Dca021801 [Dendrobium catenatum]|uniref:Uncharacterized protein n=1 Tax=Dendrobium catenatum TaxID=906689 RepID=A0A2I0WXX0_9ASPA|nr:hypothetical protein MA16_Dca021801 [Dendrobium catenatum]
MELTRKWWKSRCLSRGGRDDEDRFFLPTIDDFQPLDSQEQEEMVRSFERAHEQDNHLWRGVFAVFLLGYVVFLIYSIFQQAWNPWELRYHAYFMEDVPSWMLISAGSELGLMLKLCFCFALMVSLLKQCFGQHLVETIPSVPIHPESDKDQLELVFKCSGKSVAALTFKKVYEDCKGDDDWRWMKKLKLRRLDEFDECPRGCEAVENAEDQTNLVAILACLLAVKGMLDGSIFHQRLIWHSFYVGLVLAVFWSYYMLRLPRFRWDVLWLPFGPLSAATICLYVDNILRSSREEIRTLQDYIKAEKPFINTLSTIIQCGREPSSFYTIPSVGRESSFFYTIPSVGREPSSFYTIPSVGREPSSFYTPSVGREPFGCSHSPSVGREPFGCSHSPSIVRRRSLLQTLFPPLPGVEENRCPFTLSPVLAENRLPFTLSPVLAENRHPFTLSPVLAENRCPFTLSQCRQRTLRLFTLSKCGQRTLQLFTLSKCGQRTLMLFTLSKCSREPDLLDRSSHKKYRMKKEKSEVIPNHK